MTELDVLVSLNDHDRPQTVADRAAEAEALGFSHVSVGETTGWNVVPPLSLVADRTTTIGLGTDVLSPYGRSPALLAQTAMTLQDASDGRFRLGIGPSSPAITERWHGTDFDRPLRRVRETVEIIRTVFESGTPAYDGEIFEIDGLRYERDPPAETPQVDLATLGPKATELAGRFGDGWTPQLFTRDGLTRRLSDLARGAELGDRSVDEIRVAPIVRGFASDDRERARAETRKTIAFMLGAYGPYYGNSVAEQGYADVVSEIRDAWTADDIVGMAQGLPEAVLDELAPAGTPDEVREWIADYASVDGVDAVRVGFVRGMTDEEKRTTMEAVASALES